MRRPLVFPILVGVGLTLAMVGCSSSDDAGPVGGSDVASDGGEQDGPRADAGGAGSSDGRTEAGVAQDGSSDSDGADAADEAAVTEDAGTSDAKDLPDATETPDAADEERGAVTLVETTPTAGALHVAPLTTVKLRYSGQLDASSVNEANVLLFAPNATEPRPATVAYDDATHTITLTPTAPLETNTVYRVATNSLTDARGEPLADVAASFTTLYDTIIEAVGYDSTGSQIVSLVTIPQDADGRIARRTTMAKGPDGAFKTADDVPSSFIAWSYPTGGPRTVSYKGAGADGEWFTGDDVISTYTAYDRAAIGRERTVTYSSPGPNTIWLDDDDVPTSLLERIYDERGASSLQTSFSGPGADGLPFTGDDVISRRVVATTTPKGSRRITYSGAGPDGIWGNSDDVVAGYDDNELDPSGRTLVIWVMAAGPDATWLTADDTVSLAYEYGYDAKGLYVSARTSTGPGPDGEWLTGDDVVTSYSEIVNDANGAPTVMKGFGPGADGKYGTADDPVISLNRYDSTK